MRATGLGLEGSPLLPADTCVVQLMDVLLPRFIFLNLSLEETTGPSHPGRPQGGCSLAIVTGGPSSSHMLLENVSNSSSAERQRPGGLRTTSEVVQGLGEVPRGDGSPDVLPPNIFKPSWEGETELRWPWRLVEKAESQPPAPSQSPVPPQSHVGPGHWGCLLKNG